MMSQSKVSGPKAMVSDLLTLRVDCSSGLGGKPDVQGFTKELCQQQSQSGIFYQWTFILPQLTQASASAAATNGICGDPYQGPECCLTLPASGEELDPPWPNRAHCVVPSVIAELTLVTGSNIADNDLVNLKQAIFDAIWKYLCPDGQKVWISVTSRQIIDGSGEKFSRGVCK